MSMVGDGSVIKYFKNPGMLQPEVRPLFHIYIVWCDEDDRWANSRIFFKLVTWMLLLGSVSDYIFHFVNENLKCVLIRYAFTYFAYIYEYNVSKVKWWLFSHIIFTSSNDMIYLITQERLTFKLLTFIFSKILSIISINPNRI